jgi:hypothetical protein
MPPHKGPPQKAVDDVLDWFTVTYKTIYTAVALVVLAGAAFAYWYYARTKPALPAPSPEAAAPTITTARFTSIEGSVKVKTVGTMEWLTAQPAIVLRKGDLVRTGSGSTAEITFFDGTVIHVRPDCLITIEETTENPTTKERKVAWHISSGEVNFQTVRKNVPGSAIEFSTPALRGTVDELSTAAIRVADTGASDVKLFQGSSQIEMKSGERLSLASNEAIRVDEAGRAGPKVKLPAIPTLLAPQHQAEIAYPDPSRSITLLVWQPVPEAASYHVMLDYSPYFNRPLFDRRNITNTTYQLQNIEAGKYYWRVAAVDKENNEGSFSQFSRFTVTRQSEAGVREGPPPPLVIESLDVRTNILQAKGRTEPGATVTVNGQRVDVRDDGSFNEFIALQKTGRQVVTIRALGINGGVAELRRTVEVAF